MKYTIKWIEQKVSGKGTNYHKATLTDGQKDYTDVAIFKGYTPEQLMNGGSVEGELKEDVYNGKTSYVLNAPQTTPSGANRGQSGAVKAAEITSKSVDKSQDRKEHGIKVSSTFGKACDFAIAEWQDQRRISPSSSQTIEDLFKKWRDYLWQNYDVSETDYPPQIKGL